MTTPTSTFKEAISSNNFKEAEEMINRGDDLLKSQFQFKLSDAFPQIIKNNAYSILNALVEKEHIELDIFEYDSFRDSIFSALCENIQDTDEAVQFLSSFIPEVENLNDSLEDKTWLTIAFDSGMPPRLVQTMIDNGCDINYLNNNDNSLLNIVLNSTNFKITEEIKLSYIDLLIDNGLDTSRQSGPYTTVLDLALQNAIGSGKKAEARKFLELGADPNAPKGESKSNPDDTGLTAYHIAILRQFDFELVELLSEFNPVDFYIETPRKTTLLFDYISTIYSPTLSERDKQVLQFFSENGANPFRQNEDFYGNTVTVVDLLASKSFDFFDAFTEVFDLDVNLTDDLGNTILHKVCGHNLNFDQNLAKDLYRKVKKLIKMGADVAVRNTEDKLPVDLASDDNLKEKTVAILLKQS